MRTITAAGWSVGKPCRHCSPLDDYDAYLCGPRPFMQANWRLLRGLGIDKARIRYEFFGPATILDEDEAPAVPLWRRRCLRPPVT